MSDETIIRMFNSGYTYLEIGRHLGRTRNAIAGACRRLKLKRSTVVTISADEQAEREIDLRDLDILDDVLVCGHSVPDTARHYGVSKSFIERLKHAAREAM